MPPSRTRPKISACRDKCVRAKARASIPSSSKSIQALANANDPEIRPLFDLGCAKRPQEELFHLPSDPDQIRNVASDPKFSQTL